MSAILLLSPHTPLLFMGQEWNAATPFLYFTEHEPELGRLVTEGRRREFEAFTAFGATTIPDPQAEQTFRRSVLDWGEREQPKHAGILEWYRVLLAMRKTHPALRHDPLSTYEVRALGSRAIVLHRQAAEAHIVVVAVFEGALDAQIDEVRALGLALWSEETRFGGNPNLPLVCRGARVRMPEPGALVMASR